MASVALVYKNFAALPNVSHIGLGVAALNTAKCLSAAGHTVEVWPLMDGKQLERQLNHARSDGEGPSHVVISALWIPTDSLQWLLNRFPRIQFAVNCHSNVGFLQVEPGGVRLLREALAVEMGTTNFRVAANSAKGARWIRSAYGSPCLSLPNLYFLDETHALRVARPAYSAGPLRIGVFGATRPLKNMISAVAAAIQISYQLKAQTEIWLSSGRPEGGETMVRSCAALLENLPHVKLVSAGWNAWPQHRKVVANMHLLLSPSYTESFNMVTADGIAEGVPSVVSDAIDWVPAHWQASVDDVVDIARVGRQLLSDPQAASDGLEALTAHNTNALRAWNSFLKQGGKG